MNRFSAIFLFWILILMCFSACAEEDEDECRCGKITLNISIDDRPLITKQNFNDGERIGVFLVDYSGTTPGILGDYSSTRNFNIEYILSGSYWYPAGGEELFLTESLSDLYTYYPYDEEMSRTPDKMNLTAYPFRISTEQTTFNGENDFMWSKASMLSVNNPQANMIFKHLMSRCEINLQFNNEDDIPDDPLLKVYNTQTYGTINLRTGTVTPLGEIKEISPYRNPLVNEGYDFTFDVIILPQYLPQGTPLFSVTTAGGETLIYRTESDITVFPQNIYTFNMTVGTVQTP